MMTAPSTSRQPTRERRLIAGWILAMLPRACADAVEQTDFTTAGAERTIGVHLLPLRVSDESTEAREVTLSGELVVRGSS